MAVNNAKPIILDRKRRSLASHQSIQVKQKSSHLLPKSHSQLLSNTSNNYLQPLKLATDDYTAFKAVDHRDNWFDCIAINHLTLTLQNLTGKKNKKLGYEGLLEMTRSVARDLDPAQQHILAKCPYMLYIAHKVNPNTSQILRNLDTSSKTPRVVLNEIKQLLGKQEITELAVTWWSIWHQRNKLTFQQEQNIGIADMTSSIRNQIKNWEMARHWMEDEERNMAKQPYRRNKRSERPKSWKKPRQDQLKINFDASRLHNNHATGGIVIRNHLGQIIDLKMCTFGKTSALKAEALAFREAIWEVRNRNLRNVEIEEDNLQVINAVKGVIKCPWEIELIISDCLVSMAGAQDIRICHIPRECNAVADKIAKLGHSHPAESIKAHPELQVLIRKDALGRPPFLEGSKCAGMCMNLCKFPTPKFIKTSLGMPVPLVPNFEDMSCKMIFGEEPPSPDEDPASRQPCYKLCEINRRHNDKKCST